MPKPTHWCQYESWLPVATGWYYTTRFWNHILQVVSGFCLEQGMGYDLRPPNVAQVPQQLWNPKKKSTYEHEHILSYFLHLIYQDECWLPVAMDWYYTTRFWNHILPVMSGFCLEQGMGDDLRPPMLPKFPNNYLTTMNPPKKWRGFDF